MIHQIQPHMHKQHNHYQQHHRNQHFTPFLPSNKLPGQFVPIQPSSHYFDENEVNVKNLPQVDGDLVIKKAPSIAMDKPIFVTSTVK